MRSVGPGFQVPPRRSIAAGEPERSAWFGVSIPLQRRARSSPVHSVSLGRLVVEVLVLAMSMGWFLLLVYALGIFAEGRIQ